MLQAAFNALKNLFSTPATIDYPFEKSPKNKEARGLILFEEPKCIWCLKCEDVCPPGAIRFTQDRENFEYTYHYNPYLCIYCAECVRACPDSAVALSQSDELSPPTDDKNMNDSWFTIEKESEASKEAVKELKKVTKAAETP